MRLLLVAAALLFSGCAQFGAPEQLTLRTSSTLSECRGWAPKPRQCYGVYRMPENTLYSTFFKEELQGFTFEEGYEYTLLVRVDRISNPPADAPDRTYTLVRVLDKYRVREVKR
ncbi:DUF4377 domain-containing protein [Deinococcus hopiensis]|uniref:DUF4377 domain-containing protein n=1 Tax=Deinococcus hopiensis KR-140 TaxID=695939 RepID=A0A1W1UBX0_9DEIO|nr:DUF4377 domain-containing protein [Deinococcus hopiensis]SMB78567.1 protein of unknown function [Deinococcus hopiensis KR-140]